jgi:DNA-binding NtrC family response regulator
MESELFGYAKGAFTGAHSQKLGLLDAANGGTAFFDEIGELPLELQMKLLRVLQQKEYRAVGALAARSSNFRVIAATNRDLAQDVKENRFRQDLYYRLNVMRLRLPPLRERLDDIPALVTFFLERYGNGHQASTEMLHALQQYQWPGNIRELEHTIQRMVAMNSGPWLTPADLTSIVGNPSCQQEFIAASGQNSSSDADATFIPSQNGVMPLAELEKRAILHALAHTKGDRTIAAAMLGIGRTTLYRKLKEYGL